VWIGFYVRSAFGASAIGHREERSPLRIVLRIECVVKASGSVWNRLRNLADTSETRRNLADTSRNLADTSETRRNHADTARNLADTSETRETSPILRETS
jgi:hypothetical protein